MAFTYLPNHPRKRQVAIVRERLLKGEILKPFALVESGISKPSQVINLLRRAGLPIVTTFEEIELTADEAAAMADVDGLEDAQESGEQSRTVSYYWMRSEEIERHAADPVGQREDMRLIYRMNQERRRCAVASALFTERDKQQHISDDIRRDAALPIPQNTEGRSAISPEARDLIEQHMKEKRARALATFEPQQQDK